MDNISLRCAHNAYESELLFGRFDPSAVREAAATYEANARSAVRNLSWDRFEPRGGALT